MRSKLDTKSRLAAHILALILLIMMLVYIVPATSIVEAKAPWVAKNFDNLPPAGVPSGPGKSTTNLEIATSQPAESATIGQPKTPAATKTPEPGAMKPPAEDKQAAPENVVPVPAEDKAAPAAEPAVGMVDAKAPAEPEPKAETASASIETAADTLQPDAAATTPVTDAKTAETVEIPDTTGAEAAGTAESASSASGRAGVDDAGAAAAAEAGKDGDAVTASDDAPQDGAAAAMAPRQDESALPAVAASNAETAGQGAGEVLEPLPNANLQVLGDGVYWLNPEDELEKELSAIPEIGTLIYLTNMPGLKPRGFEHVKTAVIPADAADLTIDTAERFLHLADSGAAPVVAAVLPGARGAAYFKGVYLLTNRKLGLEETLREIGDELEDSGTAADEIIHRLRRFAGSGQKAGSGRNAENTEKE